MAKLAKTQVAAAFLVLPDGRYVLQRRTDDAPISPGKLGLFGGHLEKGENLNQAFLRELAEETSLDIPQLKPSLLGTFDLTRSITGNREVQFHLFLVKIPNMDFKVFEGVRAEAYGREELVGREDLASSVRYFLSQDIGV